jgi:hypothetical protein
MSFTLENCSISCRHSFDSRGIKSHNYFAFSPRVIVVQKANVSHGLLLMQLTVCPNGAVLVKQFHYHPT